MCQVQKLIAQTKDSTQTKDSLRFPIQDRRGDRFSWQNNNPFDLKDSSFIKQTIEYDPKTNQYYIVEKIGNQIYRRPTYLTYDEYYKIKNAQAETAYFKERAAALDSLNKKVKRPKMTVYDKLFDRIFGVGQNGLKVDIKPQGFVDIGTGYQGQNTLNPTLPEAARKTGGFAFDMNSNMQVNANIGDKLKLPINYNTLANFDYLNQLKLDYKGKDDEIIRGIEAGNTSFQTKSTLMTSAQNLFGIKAQLQFGKLSVTAVLANQRSQPQSQTLQGGATLNNFQKKLDDYDENRHFLLAQYFKNNYNTAMSNLPFVNSQVQIQQIEVWVTNRRGSTTDIRSIVGFMDLAENQPYNNNIHSLTSNTLPDNGSNDLYSSVVNNPTNREPALVNANLLAKGLTPVNDYEQTFARKLQPSEYYFNPQIGFISVNSQLQPDDVLAVAYQYTYNGRVYQVGEFSQSVGLDSTTGVQKVLFLKLLKATSARTALPIWNLMMKNVYSLDLTGVTKDGFKLNIMYNQPSGGLNIYLPEASSAAEGKSLLSILNLDRLNSQNVPQPDGVFDYIEGFTILSQQGKVLFPVLQPFGNDLANLAFNGVAPATKAKYLFPQLYDSIKAIAQTYANVDRFVMKGQAKGSSNSGSVALNAFNIPVGSVKVTAGGQTLVEGVDFTVDYNLGTVKVVNQAILNSGVPVKVSYENNATYGMQQQGFFGLRLEYAASKKLALGATIEHLNERPFFTKMNYGEDPISNTMYGIDANYKSTLPGLTRALNKLPFYTTKTMSSITASGEGAYFKPGHPSQIGTGNNGLIYLDDFEGSTSSIDLRFPLVAWALASAPQGNPDFPEAVLTDSVDYGKNRAKLAWYNIEPNLQDKNATNNPLKNNLNELSDPRVRMVYTNELFPQVTTNITNTQTTTFDLAFYPTDPGPYNYENNPTQITSSGKLTNPQKRWGGLMRALDQTDFETNNIQYIEFWTQDPFIKIPASTGGKLFIDLGNVSEDILKDGKRFYENGLNTPSIPAAVDSTSTWGTTPLNPIQITNSFSNDPNDRPYQDVGFDGLDNNGERRKRAYYLNVVANNFGTTSGLYQRAIQDPSNDDYVWYRDAGFDALGTGILGRYKNYNNPQGNSPVASGNSTLAPAATLYPDDEDLNHDNNLNQTEAYYEYEVDLKPGMNVGTNPFIAQKETVNVTYANGTQGTENWYLFRVPITSYATNFGQVPDFKSIRFMRMYLTGFQDSVVLRFASLNLVRNTWRQFAYNVDTTGSYTPINNATTTFNTLAVNVEQNSSRTPVNYLIPPGIQRVQLLSNNGVNLLQNEQSMSMQVGNLAVGDARAVFKSLNNYDMRLFGKMLMFAHAEAAPNTILGNNQLNLVMRIGQDYLNNYYEIKFPLQVTPPGTYSTNADTAVWPAANNLDFDLQTLVNIKLQRNKVGASIDTIFRQLIGTKTFSVLGNPNIGQVTSILIGVENAKGNASPLSAEIWVDELRLSNISEKGAYAAVGKVDVTLADLGKITVSGSMHTAGWGSLESNIGSRALDNYTQFDAAISIDAGKLVPKRARLSIPFYASINRTVSMSEYDPYNLDVLLKNEINSAATKAIADSIRNSAIDQVTIKTINFTNVRVLPKGKIHLLSLSNFSLNFSLTNTEQSNPNTLFNNIVKWRAGIGYSFQQSSKFKEPFKKLIKNKSPWFSLIRDFNYNLKPSLLSFRTDINRQFGQYAPRIVNTDLTKTQIQAVDTSYDKYFTFDRYYNTRWDLARSLNFDFTATDNARVNEPYGLLNTKAKKDSVVNNFLKGGTNTQYQQKASISYTFPLSKLLLTDWITVRYTYATSYHWIGASPVAITQGNTLENSQNNILTGQFDLTKLYAKNKWLRAVSNASQPKPMFSNSPQRNSMGNPNLQNPPAPDKRQNILGTTILPRDSVVKNLKGKERRLALQKWRQQKRDLRTALRLQKNNDPQQINALLKLGGQLLTMVKSVSVNYSENYNSRVPGYMDSTKFLGQDLSSMQPGWDYIFGRQPDTAWLNKKAAQGLFTHDSTFNSLYTQNFEQKLSFNTIVQPIRDLKIDISFTKSFNKNYTELFKDTLFSNNTNYKEHLNPYASGGFSISFLSIGTLFETIHPNVVSPAFQRFEDNRTIISKRIAQSNPYWRTLPTGQQFTSDGFATGYGRYSQDVLIPAFIAAYTNKSPYSIALVKETNSNIKSNPFSGTIPKPNWSLNYTGLSKIPFLQSIFSQINIRNAYSGTLSMNSFTSALTYSDPLKYGAPGFIDSISGNFVPFYLVPNITMSEQFSPLLGIDVTTTKQMGFKFEYSKSRTLSLSLIDYQMSETNSTMWTFGASWRKKGLRLPFKLPGMDKIKIQNDITFKLDVSMRNDATSNSTVDQNNSIPTNGQKVVIIQPAIDYIYNKRINVKLFFTQTRTTPFISTTAPSIYTKAGLQVRINLAQ